MTEDYKELNMRVRAITEQVMRRMLASGNVEAGALALIPSFVPDAGPVAAYLKGKYGDGVLLAGEGAAAIEGFKAAGMETRQEKQRLMAALKGYADVLLVSPPLWMLKNIAAGDDAGFCEQAFMRALLWNKNVSVVLDFERPKFSRGTFFEGVNDALRAIEDMGASVVSLKLSVDRPEDRPGLVTETQVVDAHRQGRERVWCAAGAIVTPLARDKARELGILIEE